MYHLATFNEPLGAQTMQNLPAHIIEEPAPETSTDGHHDGQRQQYANVHQMVR